MISDNAQAMPYRRLFAVLITFLLCANAVNAQGLDQLTSENERSNRNFNPHNNDTTKQKKEIPKGIHVWTVDRRFGDRIPAEVDTLPHLYPQSTLGMGRYGEYNTTGNNYTARLSRIFMDRKLTSQFSLIDTYDQVLRQPEEWHFTNTFSPITNLGYDNCGDKNNGEDHLNARFAVNAGRRVGLGFDIDYLYARGYFQNQSTSHFNGTVYGSYLGDQYQLHALFAAHHQKASENGGITIDTYITHPEHIQESFSDNEIPTILSSNWNRNNTQRLFLTHRYALGFYRKVPMTEEEIKARQFAEASKKEQEKRKQQEAGKDKDSDDEETAKPMGRPDGAKVAGAEPTLVADSLKRDVLAADTTRIRVTSKEMSDSLLAAQARQDSIDARMKSEFVPVTSFIHTLDIENHDHIYQAYRTPASYYADTYYNKGPRYTGDSIYDQTRLLDIKNTAAIALLEGFNKYVPMGLKIFATHELRRFQMPELDEDGAAYLGRRNEHNVSIGGQLIRSLGKTFHYNATLEAWVVGEDAGQLKLNAATDLNFRMLGDTVTLAASGYFYRLNPTFLQRHYHSKHLWWDNDLNKETRTRLEGTFSYRRTNTTLRIAIEEIQNYTYLGMSYVIDGSKRQQMTASVRQYGSNLNVLTAQLDQKLKLGPLHWDNRLTYQSSSNKDVLPLPALNVFSNLYLEFMVAKVLRVELGGTATYFTRYYAPDFCPMLNQYAVQQNADSRVELGNFPIIDVYANLHLKHARFFIMMNNATGTSFNRMSFLAPHYPINRSTLHLGISWNFFN